MTDSFFFGRHWRRPGDETLLQRLIGALHTPSHTYTSLMMVTMVVMVTDGYGEIVLIMECAHSCRLVARGVSGSSDPIPASAGAVGHVPQPSSVHSDEAKTLAAPVVSSHEVDKMEFERRRREKELQKAREEKREMEEIKRRVKARLYENRLDRALKVQSSGVHPSHP